MDQHTFMKNGFRKVIQNPQDSPAHFNVPGFVGMRHNGSREVIQNARDFSADFNVPGILGAHYNGFRKVIQMHRITLQTPMCQGS